MTLTLTGADIRGYYAALGVRIPEWATRNASVRCFANPDHHQHEDRTPSASVDLISGAFHCHGCGAHGGAYDAALTQHQHSAVGDRPDDRARSHRTPLRPAHRPRTHPRPDPSAESSSQETDRTAGDRR